MGLARRYSLDVEPEAAAADDVALDNRRILIPARDLEAARMDPVERLPGLFGEALDPFRRELDELDHQLALAHAAHHAGGAGRGLRSDLVLVDQHDALHASPDEMERSRRAEAARADYDHIGS